MTESINAIRKAHFILILVLICVWANAQVVVEPTQWLNQLNLSSTMPEKLLSTRTAVFYQYGITEKELTIAQEYFQRTGIDAVVYMEVDMLLANADAVRAFSDYLTDREIPNLIFLEKNSDQYRIVITQFNGKESVIDKNQAAWSVMNANFTEAIKTVYRIAANSLKKQNMLINDLPETDYSINFILGKRNDFFAMDLKVDMLAVPKTGMQEIDSKLEAYFQANYPLKFKMTDPGLSDKDLRKQGFLYVIRFIYARGISAKKLLGYDLTKTESAYVSVTYSDGQTILKNLPANSLIFKVYFKHIDSGNVFLGTKWDADLTWEGALQNQIKGMKAEFKIQ